MSKQKHKVSPGLRVNPLPKVIAIKEWKLPDGTIVLHRVYKKNKSKLNKKHGY